MEHDVEQVVETLQRIEQKGFLGVDFDAKQIADLLAAQQKRIEELEKELAKANKRTEYVASMSGQGFNW